jgi:hypothetical protein
MTTSYLFHDNYRSVQSRNATLRWPIRDPKVPVPQRKYAVGEQLQARVNGK